MAHEQLPTDVRVPASFDVFYASEYPPTRALACALAGSWVVAESLTRQSIFAAHRDWDQIGRLPAPDQWLNGQIVSGATSRLGLIRARLAIRLGGQMPSHATPDTDSGPFWRLVEKLPKRHAQALALLYVASQPPRAIAATLNIAEAKVQSLLTDAHSELTAVLSAAHKGKESEKLSVEATASRAGAELLALSRHEGVPPIEDVSSTAQRARRMSALLSTLAVVGLLAAFVLLATALRPPGNDNAAVPTTLPDDALLMPAVLAVGHEVAQFDFSIRFPSDWRTAPAVVTPETPDEIEIFAGGTGNLIGTSSGCSDVPIAFVGLEAQEVILVIRERIGYTPGELPTVIDFAADNPEMDQALDPACFVDGRSSGAIGFERKRRGFTAIWGFGPAVSGAAQREVWDVLTEFDPEPQVVSSIVQSEGTCGVADLPDGWREEAFASGPLLLWTRTVDQAAGKADTTQTVAVVAGTEEVSIAVPEQASSLVSLLWDDTGTPRVATDLADGINAVALLPCPEGDSLHVGGFVVAAGVTCVPIEVRIGHEVALRPIIPVTGGTC